MAEDLKIRAVIEFLLQGKGAQQAVAELKKLEASTLRTQDSLKRQAVAAAAAGKDTSALTAKITQLDGALVQIRSKQAELSAETRKSGAAATDTGRKFTELRGRLDALGVGLGSTKTGLAGVGAAGKTAAAGVATLGTVFRSLFAFLAPITLLYKAFQFLKNSIVGVADEARRFRALQIQIDELGIKGGLSLATIRQRLIEIERAGGAAFDSLLPVVQKFIALTRDTAVALELAALAGRIEETGLLDAATAGEALANVLAGRATLAAKALGVQIQQGASNAEVLRAVFATFPTAVGEIQDTTNAFDRLSGAISHAGRSIGETLQPATKATAGFLATVVDGAREAVGNLIDVASAILAIGNAGAQSRGEYLQQFKDLAEASAERRLGIERTFGAEFLSQARQDALATAKARTDAEIEGLEDGSARRLVLQARLSRIEAEQSAIATKEAEDAKSPQERAAEIAQQLQARRQIEATRNTSLEALRAEIEVLQAGAPRRLELQREVLRLEREQALDNSDQTGEDKSEINDAFRRRELAAIEKHGLAVAALARQQAIDEAAARAQTFEPGTGGRLEADTELSRLKRENEIAEAKLRGADVDAINRTFDALDLQREKDHVEAKRRQREQSDQDALAATIGALEANSAERLALELELSRRIENERVRIAKKGEEDITAIRLAGVLERYQKEIAFVEAQESQRRAQLGNLADAETDAELAAIDEKLASLKDFSRQAFELQLEAAQIKAQSDIDAIEQEKQDDIARLERRQEYTNASIDLFKEEAVARAVAADASEEEISDIEARFDERIARSQEKTEKAKTVIAKIAAKRVEGIQSQLNTAIAAMDKARAQGTVDSYLQMAQAIGGVITGLFGQSKGAAIASAVINTAVGVTQALAQGGIFGIITGAIVAAAGLIQIRQIAATNIDGGGSVTAPSGGAPSLPEPVRTPSFVGEKPSAPVAAAPPPQRLPSFQSGGQVDGAPSEAHVILAHGREIVTPLPPRGEVRRVLLDSLLGSLTDSEAASLGAPGGSFARLPASAVPIGAASSATLSGLAAPAAPQVTVAADPGVGRAIERLGEALSEAPRGGDIVVRGDVINTDRHYRQLERRIARAARSNLRRVIR